MQFVRTLYETHGKIDTCYYEHPSYPGFRALVSEPNEEHVDLTLGRLTTDDFLLHAICTTDNKVVDCFDDLELDEDDCKILPSAFEDADEFGLHFKKHRLHDVLNFVTHRLSNLK